MAWEPDVLTALSNQLHNVAKDVESMKKEVAEDLAEIKKTLKEEYVNVERYKPIERIVYGMVGAMLLVVINQILRAIFPGGVHP